MPTLYIPVVCPNKSCLEYGDSVPAENGKCFICHTPLVPYTQIIYEDVHAFVRRVLENRGNPATP